MRPFVHFLKTSSNSTFLQKLLVILLVAIFSWPNLLNAQPTEEYLAFEVVPPSFFHVSNAPYNHYPEEIVDFNGKAAFKQSVFSSYLWVSDGSVEGTTRISFPEWDKIMLENPRSSLFSNRSVVVDNKLFFTVEINKKNHIWATDGTQEGTYEVVSPETAGYHTLRTMRAVGNRIAFLAFVVDEGEHIFFVNEDGTEIQKITELSSSPGSATISTSLATIGDNLYVAESDAKKRYLTKIDVHGNVNRVWQLPILDSDSFGSISQLTEAIDRIYFIANQGKGSTLWSFDGTTVNRLFNPSVEAKNHRGVGNLTIVEDKAYFFSNPWNEDLNDGKGGFQNFSRLYYSDGSAGSTHQIWDSSLLGSGVYWEFAINNPMAAAGDRILFTATHKETGDDIFFGAGTTSSSIEVIEVDGATFTKYSTDPNASTVKDGAWFTGQRGLIFTDGTTDGTYKALGKELHTYGKVGIVSDRPWFVADYSGRNERTLGIWRALPLDEWSPTRPILLKPESKSDTTSVIPKFVWEKVVNTDSYHLQISELNDFSELVFSKETIEDTTFTLSDSLSFSTKYYWRVLAQNADTTGEWSEVQNFTTVLEKPDTPILSKPENKAEKIPLNSISTRFSWNSVEGASSYQIQISESDDFKSFFIDKNEIYAFSHVDTTYAENTTYYWRVKAINKDGESGWSETWSFTTILFEPDRVELISPAKDSTGLNLNPTLSWQALGNADSYTVQLATNPIFLNVIMDSSQVTTTSLQVPFTLRHSTKYHWRVRGENTVGLGDWSYGSNFTTQTPVSTESENIPTEFTLQQNYPNPFNPTTQIRYGIKDAVDVKLTVYNMLGQEVVTLINEKKSAGWHTVTFDASGFSSGFYIYRIQAGNFVNTKKLMLIK